MRQLELLREKLCLFNGSTDLDECGYPYRLLNARLSERERIDKLKFVLFDYFHLERN